MEKTKSFIEHYIYNFIESQSYMTAAVLVEHFSVHLGESFLVKMMENKQFKAAEKWAMFMGKPMICLLVQKYVEMKMLKNAYDVIKMNNLKEEFPDVQRLYKESSLKKLAEKGLWDIAELRAMKDRQLLEFVVYLAMEAGYAEKVFELCDRYSLEGFDKLAVGDAALYLALLGLFANELAGMKFSFFLFCGYIAVSLLSPVMHNLWIWRGTGNANFYFATGLAYACLQTVLVVESVSTMLNHDRMLQKQSTAHP